MLSLALLIQSHGLTFKEEKHALHAVYGNFFGFPLNKVMNNKTLSKIIIRLTLKQLMLGKQIVVHTQ